MYRLHTNEGEFLVTQNPSKLMARYIKAKRAQGYRLADIMFCWGRVNVSLNAESLVKGQETKAEEWKQRQLNVNGA